MPHLNPSAALDARLVRDPAIMGGEAVFRGTRVPLRVVLATLADHHGRRRSRGDRLRRRIGGGRSSRPCRPDTGVKAKLDENLPTRLAHVLRDAFHDVDTVRDEGLTGSSDADVFRAAQDAGRFFLTHDLDFADTRRFPPGRHRGILVLRLANPGSDAVIERVRQILRTEDVGAWDGCVVVVSEHKVRVQRPASAA